MAEVKFVEHSGKQYTSTQQVTNAYLEDELTDEQFDELFDLVAVLVEGRQRVKPKEYYDYWGDKTAPPTTVIKV